MKKYRVGIILSTTYIVEAEDEEEAEELAKDMAEEEYLDLNIEEANFVEEETSEEVESCEATGRKEAQYSQGEENDED